MMLYQKEKMIMEQQKKDIKNHEENLKELLREAYCITVLLEENLEMAKEEQNTFYTVRTLHRLLKEMQDLLEGGEEVL